MPALVIIASVIGALTAILASILRSQTRKTESYKAKLDILVRAADTTPGLTRITAFQVEESIVAGWIVGGRTEDIIYVALDMADIPASKVEVQYTTPRALEALDQLSRAAFECSELPDAFTAPKRIIDKFAAPAKNVSPA